MRDSGPRASRAEIVLLAALAAWAAFPIVLLLTHAAQTHTTFTGADGLIGADGVLGADQLQYLAWARDAGAHGLASDLFTLAPNGHVYLEPLFTITGALWKAGLSLQLAYLLWKPVAVVVLLLGALAWARRAFGDQLPARAAAVALGIFLCTPLASLFSWTQTGGAKFGFQLYLLGDELLGADKLWGYVPSALGLALVPLALLALERGLDPSLGVARARTALSRRSGRGQLIVAALASLLASWLHPWQGITLLVIFIGLAAWRRRDAVALVIPAVGAALPLGYYYWLSHSDAAWKLASHYEQIGHLSPLVLLAGFGPLVLIALPGLRRPDGVVFEQVLLLWIGACFVTYFVNDAFSPHALQGLSFPFAVLAVRSGQRLRLPPVLAAVAVALLTIPGLAYDARKFVRVARGKSVQYYLPSSDVQALKWLASPAAPPGGVLAPTPFAAVVPGQTGRRVWVGHGYWSRDYPARAKLANALFRGHMPTGQALAFIGGTGVKLLVSDCAHNASLTKEVGPIIRSVRSFGCARVYVLDRLASR
jgi:hypothetical protein